MATIKFDCELLLQPLPEKALTDAQHFHVFHDAQARPIIICTTAKEALLLIAPDELGQNQVVDLSQRLGLSSTDKVKALAITQDQSDIEKIYLAFATQDKPNEASRLHVLKPFNIGQHARWWDKVDWKGLMMGQVENTYEIHRLLLARCCKRGSDYPFLAAERSLPGIPKHNVSRVRVNMANDSWHWEENKLALPFDVSKLDDLCVASSPVRSGIVFLDKTQGKPSVTFTDLRETGEVAMFCNLPILPNPTSIAIVDDRDGASNVLIAGDGGILHVPAQDWVDSVPLGTTWPPTLSDPAFQGAHELRVAQTGPSVTVWAVNAEGHVVGQTAELRPREYEEEIDDLFPTGDAVPLFPTDNNAIQHYDAVLDPVSGRQELFVLRTDGFVARFTQAGDSQMWSTSNLKIPDPDDVEDVCTFTCHVQCKSDQGLPLAKTNVQVSTTSQIRGAINGEIVYLSQNARSVETDEAGNLTIILPADDLAVPDVIVEGPGLPRVLFQPAEKAVEKLAAAAQSGKLKNARGKDGAALCPDASDESIQAIARLHQTYKQKRASNTATTNAAALSGLSVHNLHTNAAGTKSWSFFQWLLSGAEKLMSFIVEGGKFIIRTAKKVWSFVVETAEHALKAIWGVLKWIGAKLEGVIIWLAEFLDWESILDVQLYLKSFVLAEIDCVDDLLEIGGEHLDGWLAAAEKEVGSWHSPPELPASLANQALKADTDKDKEKEEEMNNPRCKWVDSKLQDKQVRNSFADNKIEDKEEATLASVLQTFTNEVLMPIWETLKDTAGHIWDDLKKLFDKNSSVTFIQVLKNIGVDLLLGVIQGIRQGVKGIIAVVRQVLRWIRSVLNEKLQIWVLTKLYKKVTGGQDLTLLNLATLVFAVPGSWMFKLAAGKKPREVPKLAKLLTELDSTAAKGPGVAQNSHAPSVAVSAKQAVPLSLQANTLISTQALAVDMPPEYKHAAGARISNSEKQQEHPGVSIRRKLDSTSSFTKFKRLYRGGMMVVACVMPVVTLVDCVATGIAWPTAMTPVEFKFAEGWVSSVWMRFKPLVGLVAWLATSAASLPLDKSFSGKRAAKGVVLRWCLWLGKTALNLIKIRLPDHEKAIMVGLVGVTDVFMYGQILLCEAEGEETDNVPEAVLRFVEDAWAIGSWHNCVWKGAEPIGLTITVAAGAALTIANGIKAYKHVEYWQEHGDDKDYNPPTFPNAFNGSLL